MLGIGFGEAAVIVILAVLVLGPERLPEFAQQAGRFVRQLRKYATSARDELRSELGPEFSDLELRDLDPRAVVRRHIAEAMAELDELEDAEKRRAATGEPLAFGERPPYDAEAT